MVTCYTTPNQYHIAAALEILASPDSDWNDVGSGGKDDFADQIVEKFATDPIAVTLVTGDMRKMVIDPATLRNLRRGWGLLKAVLGEAVAVPLVCKAGALAVIGAYRTLSVLEAADDTEKQMISVASTMTAYIAEVLAEYNNAEGRAVLGHLLTDIPLTSTDRSAAERACEQIDYSSQLFN